MRKIRLLIRNIYRVLIVKPNGDSMVINCTEQMHHSERELLSDSTLRQIITADELSSEPDPQIRKILEQRVERNKRGAVMAKNSLFDIFLPVFSLKQIELKMAVITLALILSLGINSTNNHSSNRNFNLFFLADTLIDTSAHHLPAVHDSAFNVHYK